MIAATFNSGAQVVSGLVSTVTISTVSDGRTIVTVTILTLQRSRPDDFTTTTFRARRLLDLLVLVTRRGERRQQFLDVLRAPCFHRQVNRGVA